MAPKKFKVLIAGGSVTGLTLANMLEAVGVDYVVLESHSEIAPQVGASIAVMPNALRILDQLGMYEEIRDLWDGLNEISGMRRSSDGAALHSVYGTMEHTVRR
jgi:2-polyprenyl-6-methoxyphenol hydroxylase-like FAD-dependent oxidoreductase